MLDTVPGYAKVWRRLALPVALDLQQTHAALQCAFGWQGVRRSSSSAAAAAAAAA